MAQTFPVLDLGLDVVDGVAALDLKRDRLPRHRLHEDLHLAFSSWDPDPLSLVEELGGGGGDGEESTAADATLYRGRGMGRGGRKRGRQASPQSSKHPVHSAVDRRTGNTTVLAVSWPLGGELVVQRAGTNGTGRDEPRVIRNGMMFHEYWVGP